MDHGETHWVRPMVKVVVQGVLYTNPLGGFLSYACRGNNFAISKQIDFNIEVDMGLFKANPHSHLLPNVMENLQLCLNRQDRANYFVQERGNNEKLIH